MTAQNVWKILHILSLLYYAAGLGGVLLPLYRGWKCKDVRALAATVEQAAANETGVLLPGLLLTGLTGVFWAASAGYNYFRDLWLLALALLYLFSVFICLPLLGVGLRRAHLLVLQAQKRGQITDELRETLNDNVPLVFGTFLAVLMPVMAWLAIFKP